MNSRAMNHITTRDDSLAYNMGYVDGFLDGLNFEAEPVADAVFVSVWNEGSAVIQTHCKVNLSTREVFDIQVVDVLGSDFAFCDEEYVLLDGERKEVEEVDGQYFLVEND